MDINETIAEVLRLDAEATPGPWSDRYTPEGGDVEVLTDLPVKWAANLPEGYAPGRWDARTICDLLARRGAMRPGLPHGQRVADATLIAYYRTAAPALAREVLRLQGECIDLHSALDLSCEREARAHLRGQEAMRERCAARVDRAANEACECDGTLCGPGDVAPHDADCLAWDLDDLAGAIRALEVE